MKILLFVVGYLIYYSLFELLVRRFDLATHVLRGGFENKSHRFKENIVVIPLSLLFAILVLYFQSVTLFQIQINVYFIVVVIFCIWLIWVIKKTKR